MKLDIWKKSKLGRSRSILCFVSLWNRMLLVLISREWFNYLTKLFICLPSRWKKFGNTISHLCKNVYAPIYFTCLFMVRHGRTGIFPQPDDISAYFTWFISTYTTRPFPIGIGGDNSPPHMYVYILTHMFWFKKDNILFTKQRETIEHKGTNNTTNKKSRTQNITKIIKIKNKTIKWRNQC